MTDINETENALPADALERLVNRVVAKFTLAEISTEEAASRLVGTGRFEENGEALEFLRGEICPKLEVRLHEVEEDVQRLKVEADRIRGILTQSARGPSLLATVGSPSTAPILFTASAGVASASARSRKEKADKEKSDRKRKGAVGEHTETVWGSHEESAALHESASAPTESVLPARALVGNSATGRSAASFANEELPSPSHSTGSMGSDEAPAFDGSNEILGSDDSTSHDSADGATENDPVDTRSRHRSEHIVHGEG